ncbi:hypothetical protein [Streptomyces goshikiensis]
MKAELGNITPGGWSAVAGKSVKNTSLIGEADSGLGMTRYSISAADSDEALKENIV